MTAYLDSNVIISSVEDPALEEASLQQHVALIAGMNASLVVSDLVRMECRVKPLAKGDDTLLRHYDGLFASPDVSVVGLTASVCDRAAAIRAQYGFRTPDALHLAASVEAGCDVFVTADRQLGQFTGIQVAVYDPAPEAPDQPGNS